MPKYLYELLENRGLVSEEIRISLRLLSESLKRAKINYAINKKDLKNSLSR